VLARGQTDTDARAIWSFYPTAADGSTSGMTGDGRDAQGQAVAAGAPSVYEGNVCGVHAKIFWDNTGASQSGDAILQPDKFWSSLGKAGKAACGGTPRAVRAALGPDRGTVTGWFLNTRQIMQLVAGGAGTVGYRNFQISTTLAACEYLRYNNEVAGVDPAGTAGQIKITYQGVVDGRRTWLAESQGAHKAGCYADVNGAYAWDGVSRAIPFRIRVVEKPFGST
jgi:hypothetical protein